MTQYRLNGLDDNWTFEARDEEEATKSFIMMTCRAKTIEEYEKYCEDVGVDPVLVWTIDEV